MLVAIALSLFTAPAPRERATQLRRCDVGSTGRALQSRFLVVLKSFANRAFTAARSHTQTKKLRRESRGDESLV